MVKEVLKERDTTIEVDIDLVAELLLTRNGGHLNRVRAGVVSPLLVLGVLEELTKGLEKVKSHVEVKIVTLLVKVDVLDVSPTHVDHLDNVESTLIDALGKKEKKRGGK